jgi:hypothetical protein
MAEVAPQSKSAPLEVPAKFAAMRSHIVAALRDGSAWYLQFGAGHWILLPWKTLESNVAERLGHQESKSAALRRPFWFSNASAT